MRVFMFYPPGGLFQRSEDRSQANLKASTSNGMRACNDLGYMASVLRNAGDEVFLMDYPSEKRSLDDYYNDVNEFRPDVIILSATYTTLNSDIKCINETFNRTEFRGRVIIKSAIFYDAPDTLIEAMDKSHIDVMIGGEIEWIIEDIVHNKKDFKDIPGIIYKGKNGKWEKTDFVKHNENLDDIPFPSRDLMHNELYVRPDTNEPMATIQIGRGCPGGCIYCLEPVIGGNKVRTRSPENVMAELNECFYKYGIRNFYFRSGTFTIDGDWVIKLCNLIRNSDLYGKIEYTANSRVKPITYEVLSAMKDTGCFAVAFGLETGSEETMKKINKGATVEDCYKAVGIAKKIHLPVLGFYMIGFPWESKKHLKETKRLIFDLNTDFIEIHIALPFWGTKYNEMCREEGVIRESIVGKDVFHESTTGTKYLTATEVTKFRNTVLLQYHLRPTYILGKMAQCLYKPKVFLNYVKFGVRMINNILFNK